MGEAPLAVVARPADAVAGRARDYRVRLVAGSAAFGTGWGLAGFCPGPAIVSIGFGSLKGIGFVVAMLAGMAAFEWIERRRAAR